MGSFIPSLAPSCTCTGGSNDDDNNNETINRVSRKVETTETEITHITNDIISFKNHIENTITAIDNKIEHNMTILSQRIDRIEDKVDRNKEVIELRLQQSMNGRSRK